MGPDDQATKLRVIASLDEAQIEGWRDMVAILPDRPFPGEIAALEARERELQAPKSKRRRS